MSSDNDENKVSGLATAIECKNMKLAKDLVSEMTVEELLSLTNSGETLVGKAGAAGMVELVIDIVKIAPNALEKKDSHGDVALHNTKDERTTRTALLHGGATENINNAGEATDEKERGEVGDLITKKTASPGQNSPLNLPNKKDKDTQREV
jgi:hypothetical protein